MTIPEGTVIGRGRGRGRARIRPQQLYSDVEVSSQASFHSAVSTFDVIDGCMVKPTREFGDRYEDDYLPKIESLAVTQPETPKGTINGLKVDIPKELFDQDGKATVVVSSVNLDDRYAVIKFLDANVVIKCKVHLQENHITAQWKQQNPLVFNVETLIENATLSTLDFHLDKPVRMQRFQTDSGEDGYLHVAIDILGTKNLNEDFLNAVVYYLVPRLPAVNGHKIGIITNVKGSGEVDVDFYDQVSLELRQTLRRIQADNQFFAPQCLVKAKLFKELIDGFDVKYFLAPLNEDWSDLHRVAVVGFASADEVKVLYRDIGKTLNVRLKNLVGPLSAINVPEMLQKLPAQAITVRVHELDSKFDDVLKSMRIEGRVCYVQTIDDSEETPRVNIFLNNEMEMGTVSLYDLASSYINKTEVSVNTDFKPQPLKAISKKIDGLTREWQTSMPDDPKVRKAPSCQCCKDTVLGKTDDGKIIPGIFHTHRAESSRTGTYMSN